MCLLWWGVCPRHPGMACRRWRVFCCGFLAEGADSDEAFVTEGANNDDAFVAEGANFVKDYDTFGYVDLEFFEVATGPGAELGALG